MVNNTRTISYHYMNIFAYAFVSDCKVAVDRYGEVIQNLEFARDLQKQFNSINADVSYYRA